MSVDTKNLLTKLQPVCIVDDDQMMADLVADLVSEMGGTQSTICQNGAEAWDKVAEGGFNLIIMDWKMPKLGGPGLFNRLRQSDQFKRTPVIVMSALLKRDDFALLEEYPFTHSLSKPFTHEVLAEKVTQLHAEDEWYRENESKIAELMGRMSEDRAGAMRELMGLFSASKHTARLALLAAISMRSSGFVAEAKVLLEHLLKQSPNSVAIMSELGRVYIATKAYGDAETMLQKAQKLSPKNVERLCLIGEAQLSQGKSEEANTSFSGALDIDPESAKAKDGMILTKNLDTAKNAGSIESIHQSFASLMNSVAISLVRQGKFDDGIQQYQSAMNMVSDAGSKGRLAFNLGMAYLRRKQPGDAVEWFTRADEIAKGSLPKVASYIELCRRAAAGGSATAATQDVGDDVIIEF